MAYVPTTSLAGFSQITASDATARHTPGTRIRAIDPTYGEGEFVYLSATATMNNAGNVCTLNQYANTVTRTVAGSRGPVGISMAAQTNGYYGWYQVTGAGVVKSATVAANTMPYATATNGQVDDAVVAGDKIDGMVFRTADGTPAAGYAVVQLANPAMNGNG